MPGLRKGSINLLLYAISIAFIFISLTSINVLAGTEGGPNLCLEDDIMEGQRTIVSLDNLILSNTVHNPSISITFSDYFFDMNRNQVVNASSSQVFQNFNCTLPDDGQPMPFQQEYARLFDTTNDYLVTLRMGAAKGCNQSLQVRATDMNTGSSTVFNTTSSQTWIQTAVGDFDRDGFEDIFVITDFDLFILSAVDTENPSEGLQEVFRTQLSNLGLGNFAPMNDPSVHDINGDGSLEVALVGGGTADGSQLSAYVLTVCDGVGLGSSCRGVDSFVAQPAVLVTNLQATVKPDASAFTRYPAVAITAGSYGGVGGVVIVDSTSNRFTIELWQFGSDLSPVGPILSTQSDILVPVTVLAKSAKINWFGTTDQIVLGFHALGTDKDNTPFAEVQVIDVLQFVGNEFQFLINTDVINSIDGLTLTGLDTGTFTKELAAVNGDIPVNDFNLKVGLSLTAQDSSTRSLLRVYEFPFSMDGNFEFFLNEQFTFSGLTTTFMSVRGGSMLHSGDSDGLGFVFGQPTVIRNSQWQTTNVIQAPPRHADFVDTGRTDTPPQLLNISANVSNYLASYNFSETEAITSSSTSTTSYTQVTSEELEIEFSYRKVVPVTNTQVWGAGGGFDLLWRQTYNETVAKNFNTYSGVTNSLVVEDVEADYIQYSEKVMNYYVYPFLGYTACPGDNPNCSEDEQQPVNLTVTGPSSTNITVSNGRVNEFYQPVHEPVNILSYPTSEAQLRRQYSFTTPLATKTYDITGNVTEQIAQWDTSTGEEKTVGTTDINDFDRRFNVWVEGGDPKKGPFFGRVSFTVNWNTSDSLSRVNNNAYTQQSSEGLRIKLPGTFADTTLYGYRASAYIFSEEAEDIIQPLSTDTDLAFNGTLQSAFVVEPQTASNSLGSWWTGSSNWYTQFPDIALNRPAWRFLYVLNNQSLTQKPFFCLSANFLETNKLNCSFIYAPDTFRTLWESPWYFMRGFFISVGGVDGPQRTYAEAGEEVFLSFRVHNFSLYDYTQEDLTQIEAKARLYAQEWNPNNGANIPVPGVASELIEEFTFDPIPRSQDLSGRENWTILTTNNFDTEGRGGKAYVFWVVVWMERDLGNGEVELVQEVPYHGLEQLPGDLTGIRQIEEIIEWIDVNSCWIAGNSNVSCFDGLTTPTSFTNNVAFYKMPFHVLDDELEVENDPCLEEINLNSQIEIKNAAVAPDMIMEGEHVRVTAEIHTVGWENNLAENISVHEGADGEIGPAIEFEHLGLVLGDQHRLLDFHFIPKGCGEKEITIMNDQGLESEASVVMDLFVQCRTLGTGGNGSCALSGPGERSSGELIILASLILVLPLRRLLKHKLVRLLKRGETE